MGHKHIYLVGGARSARLRLLSPLMREPVRHAFVNPEGWDDVRAGFAKKRTTILRGPSGSGKMAAAIRLLQGADRLYHLSDATDLNRLAESLELDADERGGIERNAGFVLNRPVAFSALRGSSLLGLDEALLRADARLVLTVDSEDSIPDDDLVDYLVTIPRGPAYADVVASHLRWRLDEHAAERILGLDLTKEVIAEQLERRTTCHMAARLAQVIADGYEANPGAALDAGWIRDRVSRHGAEDFEIWFTSLGDSETRYFAVALAVLNGLAHERVADAARALHRRLDKGRNLVLASPLDGPWEGDSPFRLTRAERLHKLRALSRPADVRGQFGRSTAQVVEYQDADYARMVIRHVWNQYQIHDVLADWLGALADDADDQVRVCAGTALGLIAVDSFEYVTRHILGPWAASPRPSRRDAVAYALRVVAAEPDLVDNVRQLASGWYASRNTPELQATAARVHGISLASADLDAAVEALDRLSVIDDIRVAVAIGDSLADLLVDGNVDLAARILPQLEDALGVRERTVTAQLSFLILADSLMTDADEPDGTGPEVPWPSLLWLANQHSAVRNPLALLWRRVINEGVFHAEAEKIMTNWAALAEPDDAMRDVLLRLLRAVMRGDDRSVRILERYADHWVAEENLAPLPLISTALRSVIAVEKEYLP
ncbi:hypothetical protein [Actinospica acidithermotolerans]|uniref:hypothetical protein n=1 Tax=Actinospica acidithermotolerans TaxID=2828514 RepID=UPI001BA46BA9|nr:hypothetical protein [Actinospica acidithermotolerans]